MAKVVTVALREQHQEGVADMTPETAVLQRVAGTTLVEVLSLQPRDQPHDPPRDEPCDPPWDEPRDPLRDETRDPPRDEPRDQPRDQPREPPRDEPREQQRRHDSYQPRPGNRGQYNPRQGYGGRGRETSLQGVSPNTYNNSNVACHRCGKTGHYARKCMT